MRNLIEFLFRNGVFLVFIGLEVLCFRLVVRHNQEQSEIYHSTSAAINGAINKRLGSISRYWKLNSVNDSLRIENARLKEELIRRIATRATTSPAPGIASDDSVRVAYEVIPTRVLQNSIGSRNNYITLDKGRIDGIAEGMGVASSNCPVGIVVGVSKRFSRVMSILHGNTMLSATIKGKGYFGSLVWRGFNPRKMELEAVPKHARLYVGDTVVTSGYSQIFPPDLVIGTIDTFWLPRGSNFYNVVVTLNGDLGNLQTAYVYSNYQKQELEQLENLSLDAE